MDVINVQDEAVLGEQNEGDHLDEMVYQEEELPLVCKDCGMQFDDVRQFGTHVAKVSGTNTEKILLMLMS